MSPDLKRSYDYYKRTENTINRKIEDPCRDCRHAKKKSIDDSGIVEPCEDFYKLFQETGKPNCPAQFRWLEKSSK